MAIGKLCRPLHALVSGLLIAVIPLVTLAEMNSKPHSSLIEIRDHVDLHYLDWGGNKQPLLLLAGLGDSSYVFTELAPLLTSDFRVIAVTRRDTGNRMSQEMATRSRTAWRMCARSSMPSRSKELFSSVTRLLETNSLLLR